MSLTEPEIDDLLYLARIGEYDEFQRLIKEFSEREKLDIFELLQTARDQISGNEALHMAAANGNRDFIRKICKSLSNPPPQNTTILSLLNAQNMAGNTPLHWAALNGHLETVQLLVEQGADPTITNKMGHDPIYEAELNDKKEVVEWVLKEGGMGLEEAIRREIVGEYVTNANCPVVVSEEDSKDIQSSLEQINLGVNEKSS